MKSNFSGRVSSRGTLILFLFISSCSQTFDVIPKPIITVTPQIISILNENITGQIHNADANLYNIVVYGKMNEGWYTLPNREFPLIPIADDNSWVCELQNANREYISEFVIFLVPTGYAPPILQGENIIPIKMNLVAAAKKTVVLEKI